MTTSSPQGDYLSEPQSCPCQQIEDDSIPLVTVCIQTLFLLGFYVFDDVKVQPIAGFLCLSSYTNFALRRNGMNEYDPIIQMKAL